MNPMPAPMSPAPSSKNTLIIAGAIIIAGLLIAVGLFLALFLTKQSSSTQTVSTRPENPHLEKNLKPVTDADHVLGSRSAPVMIIEYSDTDCPFCQAFHPIVQSFIDTYGASGKVAWTYRTFNTQLHPHTVIESEAAECVAELNGNDAYWKYIDTLFSKKDFQTQPTKFLDPSQLPIIAASLGVNKAKFNECLNSGKYEPLVAQETKDAQASGASGTPFSFIVSKAVIKSDVIKSIEDINNQYLGQNPTAPDVIFVSTDKHIIVVGGALPKQLMTPIIDSLVQSN